MTNYKYSRAMRELAAYHIGRLGGCAVDTREISFAMKDPASFVDTAGHRARTEMMYAMHKRMWDTAVEILTTVEPGKKHIKGKA